MRRAVPALIFCLVVLGCGDDTSSSNNATSNSAMTMTTMVAPECTENSDCGIISNDWCFEGKCVLDCGGSFQCETGMVCLEVDDPYDACQPYTQPEEWPLRFRMLSVTKDTINQPQVVFALENTSDKTVDGTQIAIEAFDEFGDPVSGFSSEWKGFNLSDDIPPKSTTELLVATMTAFDTASQFTLHFERLVFKDGSEPLYCLPGEHVVQVRKD